MPLSASRQWYARLWSRGDGREQGVVILVHGLGDHGGRYETFARRLVRRNWAVFAIDLPGHGRSAGRRGTAKSYDAILQLIADSRRLLHKRLGDKDHFVLGHSMGGNFAVNYAIRQSEFDVCELEQPAGLILVAPMLMPPHFLDRHRIFAAWGTGQLFRWIRISKPVPIDQLTRDEEACRRIECDPLQHSQISLYLATQLLAQGRFALDHAARVETPTLVIHGDEDELIDQQACRHLAMRMRDKADFVRWSGGRHDLLHDVDAESVAEHLSNWMRRTSTLSSQTLELTKSITLQNQSITSQPIQGCRDFGTAMLPSAR